MKVKEKKVYYCEFCKKHGLTSYHIKEHEKHCTANPNRECGVCGAKGLNPEFKIEEIERKYDKVRGVIVNRDDCPACALAFIRQNKTNGFTKNKDNWSFPEAMKEYWEDEAEDKSNYY
jgi:hypothetical protein